MATEIVELIGIFVLFVGFLLFHSERWRKEINRDMRQREFRREPR